MVELKKALATALAITLAGASPPTQAFVFVDPLNLIENMMSAYKAVQQLAVAYDQLAGQYRQLELMARQLQSMDPTQVVGLLGDITGLQELREIEKAMAANQDLLESIDTVRRSFDERLDSAKLLRLTWDEYVRWEKGRVQRKEEAAMARMHAEIHAMKKIESDYEFARQQAGRIAGTAGTHEAMQLMNVQMNRVVQQNAELLRQISTAFGRASAEKEMQEAEHRQRIKAREAAYKEARDKDLLADRAAIDSWKAARP